MVFFTIDGYILNPSRGCHEHDVHSHCNLPLGSQNDELRQVEGLKIVDQADVERSVIDQAEEQIGERIRADGKRRLDKIDEQIKYVALRSSRVTFRVSKLPRKSQLSRVVAGSCAMSKPKSKESCTPRRARSAKCKRGLNVSRRFRRKSPNSTSRRSSSPTTSPASRGRWVTADSNQTSTVREESGTRLEIWFRRLTQVAVSTMLGTKLFVWRVLSIR